MSENKCPQCGAPVDPGAMECKFCGERLTVREAAQRLDQPQVIVRQTPPVACAIELPSFRY